MRRQHPTQPPPFLQDVDALLQMMDVVFYTDVVANSLSAQGLYSEKATQPMIVRSLGSFISFCARSIGPLYTVVFSSVPVSF